ncbi:HERV-H LTR-associating protein 1 [Elgaria multicarinata webbii]|uniref:HERV-H LTR-associating protein 1 n=1 Tax=Elgaria multicarinata webbii TaxID=159646 RepID=UPI002FCD370F
MYGLQLLIVSESMFGLEGVNWMNPDKLTQFPPVKNIHELECTPASPKAESKKEERLAVLATAELPAKSVDLAAINLTELVNGMLNTALKGSKKFFSLLSITSYSSYAFHKVSIVLYNISNLKNVDATKFPMRYCYCLNNRTNDLTDFTALLVDIVGNSTNYLTEIFKSTSIVSVSQSNESDCIYICVMSGRTGRNLSDLWEAIEKSPVINYTFSGNMSDLLGEYILNILMKKHLNLIVPGLMPLREDADKELGNIAKDAWTFKTTKTPAGSQSGALKGKEMFVTQHPGWLKTVIAKGSEAPLAPLSLWLQTDASKEYGVSSTKTTSSRPVLVESYDGSLPGALPPLTPKLPTQAWTVAAKGDETVFPQSTMERKTAALKSFEVSTFQVSPWLQTDAPKEWDVSPSPSSLMSFDLPSGTQPVPIETYTFLTWPVSSRITKAPQQIQAGCPQGIKKGSNVITPPSTLAKLNPCVMELCKFYQQCLCTRDRSYSRDKVMRYCIEHYSWFLKNAMYICEKVKRTPYSKTLKQKCLASICKSI